MAKRKDYGEVHLNINKKIWKKFKHKCIDDEESASKKVERFMREELEKD